jgi:activator of 2-hydroxyglutaryl-CoA dehydratase
MAAPLDVRPEVVFTGGVAQDEGMRLALESRLEQSVATARHPFLAAALGAALSGSSQPSILA